MTALTDIPIDSISWQIGAAACLVLGFKSLTRYRRSRDELSKYMAWFALLTGIALAMFGFPSLFTLDTGTLLVWGLAGEFFFFGGMVAQAAIMWSLILRGRIPLYLITVPVAMLGLAASVYAVPHTELVLSNDFVTFFNPRFTTLVIAVLMFGLFAPVGLYLLRMAPRQDSFKSMLTSLGLSVAYLGIGIIGGGFEIVTGQIMTRASMPSNTLFFTFLLVAVLWPRRADAKPPLRLARPAKTPR
jgi:hypothetical protein